MNTDPIGSVLDQLARVNGVRPRRNGNGWSARCPAHDDREPSLSIGEGDDGRVLLRCHAGCETTAIVEALGLSMRDLMPADGLGSKRPRASTRSANWPNLEAAIEATAAKLTGTPVGQWTYRAGDDAAVMTVVRFDLAGGGKQYRPFHPVKGGWRMGDPPGRLPLYRVRDFRGAKRVYVVEGEKVADAAWSIGLPATTSAHGAKAAAKTDWSPLAGREVIILPDHDDAGRGYADDVAGILHRIDPAMVIKIVNLPGLPVGGDAVDWCDAQDAQNLDDLRRQVEALADAAMRVDAAQVSGQCGPMMTCLADVKPQPIRWLWQNRIALGKLTMIAGDPGLGKSLVTLDIAARVSSDRGWPDQSAPLGGPGGVILLSAEDDAADTIRPRLDAAGADVRRIHQLTGTRRRSPSGDESVEGEFNLRADLPVLEQAIRQTPDCRLVVIDPISAYLGKTDSHVNAEVRAVLGPLSCLAAKYGVAVVAVTHLRKGDGPAIYRTMGSLAFTAAARAAWGVVKDKNDPDLRLFLSVKSNLACDVGGLAYRVEVNDSELPFVRWSDQPVTTTADDAMSWASHAADDNGHSSARDDAAEWLRTLLADGPMPAGEVKGAAKDDGIAPRTLDRAKQALGVVARREGFGRGGRWVWELPHSAPTDAIGHHDSDVAHNGDSGAQCDDEKNRDDAS